MIVFSPKTRCEDCDAHATSGQEKVVVVHDLKKKIEKKINLSLGSSLSPYYVTATVYGTLLSLFPYPS